MTEPNGLEDIKEISDDVDEIAEDTDEILRRIDKNQRHTLDSIKASKQNKFWIIGLFLMDKIIMAMLILFLSK